MLSYRQFGTINLYIEGLDTGNIDTLKKALHSKAIVYGIGAKTVTVVEIEGLYAYVAANMPPSKSGEPHESWLATPLIFL